MAQYVTIANEYVNKVIETAQVVMDWGKLLIQTDAEYEVFSRPNGASAVYTIDFPFTDAGESATSGSAPTAGAKVEVSHSIAMGERNSKKLPLHNLATLVATSPQAMKIVKRLTENWITELNTQVKTYAMSTIGDTGNYTHEVNNSGAGGAQDVITAGYSYLGNDESASETALTSVVAGDVLTPGIFRKMIGTLRARKAHPVMIEGAPMYIVGVQREQIQYLKKHADFKASVNAPLDDWSKMQVIFGADSFYYEGGYIVPLDDASKASTVGAGGTDTAHYAIFMGRDFLGFPHKDPKEIQLSDDSVERLDLFGQAEIRFGSDPTDAPLYKTRAAAWVSYYGMGIVNPLAAIKLVLHSDFS